MGKVKRIIVPGKIPPATSFNADDIVINSADSALYFKDSRNNVNKIAFSGKDALLGNYKFDGDQSVGADQDNHVLTYDNSSGKISLEAASGGGTTPQNFPMSFETQLTSGDYFFGSLRYGWNYVVWNRSDNNMQLAYFELVSAMVAINDYTAISVKGIAGSMKTSNSVTIEFSLWKGTNSGGTGTLSTTEIASTTVDYSQSDEMKPLSFGATGLTINEGDYIFFAVRNTSYSIREDVACSITITFS